MRTAIVFALVLAACATRPPVAPGLTLPPDTAQECVNVCQRIGLQLSAVVVVANSAGCVCEVQPGPPPGARQGGASAASAGAIIVAAEERRIREQQQRRVRQQQHPH